MNRRDAIKALMVALPATATLSAAKVEPDDVIVVELDTLHSYEQIAKMKDHLGHIWPGRKVVVVGPHARLKIAKANA